MSVETKCQASIPDHEVTPQDPADHRQQKGIRLCHSIRLGLTTVALLSGIAILGASVNALMVYHQTRISSDFHLPLWPESFNLRPTVALVVAGVIVTLANFVSLVFSSASAFRNKPRAQTTMNIMAPFCGFVAVLVAVAFFYAVNASPRIDTLQSWSCQWAYVQMHRQPYFATLCGQSKTAVYLSVILVPVQLMALTVTFTQMDLERKAAGTVSSRKPTNS
ncbi:hypothetical protein GGS21DRAFT_488981 [Xylaria nigripes]|nr:hypothetical protein GGS21DRAFT_488981 [Xylaria nigripes]